MDRFILDLRLALRRLRQNPTFSAVAVLTLALGIGANTAIFSVINAALLRHLPVARRSEIVSLNEKMGADTVPTLSFPNYRDLRDRNTVLSGMMAYRFLPASLGLPGNNQRLWGYLVTGNYFDVLGVGAVRGRVLRPDDDLRPGANPVAVLAWSCWQKRFGGDPAVVGSTVKFNGMDFTILGVAPEGFFGTELFFRPDVFFPMTMQKQLEGGKGYLENRDAGNFFVDGRLKPGVSMARAEAGLNSVARGLAQQYPKNDDGMQIVLTPPGLAGNYIRGAVIGFAAALFGVSCLVLLVACTNLASILMARAADRRKEIALRLAVGAGRGSLVRQLLTENLVIAILGGAGGALLALWITDALAAWRPPTDFPLVIGAAPDGRVFLFALTVSVLTTLLFGLLPALQATRTNLVGALKNEAISERLRRWQLRDYMVATQAGLSALLLVCSVLVVRSLQRALDAPIGYNPKGAVTASFDLNIQGYSVARGREFQRRLLDKVRAIPGIESAAVVDWLPLSLSLSSDSIYIEGEPIPKPTEVPDAYSFSVSSDYFRTMQTRLLMGREFDSRDKQDGTRVAVVNKAFADQLLRGRDPIGKRFSQQPGRQAHSDRRRGGRWQILLACGAASGRMVGPVRDLVHRQWRAGGSHEPEREPGVAPDSGCRAGSGPDAAAVLRQYAGPAVAIPIRLRSRRAWEGVAAERAALSYRRRERMADHGHLYFARLVVVGCHGAAKFRRDPQNPEELSRDSRAVHADSRSIHREIQTIVGKQCEARKRVTLFLPVVEVCIERSEGFEWQTRKMGIGRKQEDQPSPSRATRQSRVRHPIRICSTVPPATSRR
jgi:predicted permease